MTGVNTTPFPGMFCPNVDCSSIDFVQRKSPRQQGLQPQYFYDVLVTCGINEKTNKANGKVLTVHHVPSSANLDHIKRLLRDKVPDVVIKAGVFWMKKTGKDINILETDEDLAKAMKEHTLKGSGEVKDLKLAVHVLGGKRRAVKRKLDVGKKSLKQDLTGTSDQSDDSEDNIRLKQFDESMENKKGSVKSNNSKFNMALVELNRYLENKGKRTRYNFKHLSLWAQLISDGELVGPTEEPNWKEYMSQIDYLPKDKPVTSNDQGKSGKSDDKQTFRDLYNFFMVQQQARFEEDRMRREEDKRLREEQTRRDTLFQSALLAALSPRPDNTSFKSLCASPDSVSHASPSVTVSSISSSEQQKLTDMNENDVSELLVSIGMEKYCGKFCELGIDGPTLSQIQPSMLVEMGCISSQIDAARIVGHARKLMR